MNARELLQPRICLARCSACNGTGRQPRPRAYESIGRQTLPCTRCAGSGTRVIDNATTMARSA